MGGYDICVAAFAITEHLTPSSHIWQNWHFGYLEVVYKIILFNLII